MAKRKVKHYEVLSGFNASGKPAYIVHIVGNPKTNSYFCATWGTSQSDKIEIQRLVDQANQVNESEKTALDSPHLIYGQCISEEELAAEREKLSPKDRARLDALPKEFHEVFLHEINNFKKTSREPGQN